MMRTTVVSNPSIALRTLVVICILLFLDPRSVLYAQNPFQQRGFVENIGQLHYPDGRPAVDVLYKWQGTDFNVLFYKDKFVYEIQYAEKAALEAQKEALALREAYDLMISSQLVEYRFGSAKGKRQLKGLDRYESKISYPGEDVKRPYRPGVCEQLVYVDVFPNVDLVFSTTAQGQCKYDIVLHEGADLADVDFNIGGLGQRNLRVDGNKAVAQFPFGKFIESVPEAFSKSNAGRKDHHVAYDCSTDGVLKFRSEQGTQLIDPGEELVIDPVGNIVWGTYFAPVGSSSTKKVKARPGGVLYATGHCASAGLVTANTGSTYSGNLDIWVAQFQDADLTLQTSDLIWCRVVGGSNEDVPWGMDVCNDLIAVCGWTHSPTGIATDGLPIDAGNADGGTNTHDGFLIYFDASNFGAVTYGTYIGGDRTDYSWAVALDCRESITSTVGTRCYVSSFNTDYPLDQLGDHQFQSAPFQGVPVLTSAYGNVILQQYGPSSPLWTTWYGSGLTNSGGLPSDLTIDRNGQPIMICAGSGNAASYGITFNSITSPNNEDYVIASFAPDGSLNWARYWGTVDRDPMPGWPADHAAGIAVGAGNEIYVGGHAGTTLSAPRYSYVSRIENSTAPVEHWRVNLPSNGNTCSSGIWDLSVSCNGSLYVAGMTDCPTGFATTGSYQPNYGGGPYDGFLTEIQDLGQSANIVYTTYYGGNDWEFLFDLDARQEGDIYICGSSFSGSNGIVNNGLSAWQPPAFNTEHAYIARFEGDVCCAANIVIPDGTTTTAPVTYTNETIRVEGQWYIDHNTTLVNCVVYAMTGAEIIVGTTGVASFDLHESHISSCEDMWRGVRTIPQNGRVKLSTSSIADAQYGVWLQNGTSLYAHDSQFKDNYVGVHVHDPNATVTSAGLILGNCTFNTSTSGLKFPYPAQSPPPGDLGFAGVSAKNTTLTLSSPGAGDNLFQRMNHGIHIISTTLTLTEARFEDMEADPIYGNAQQNGSAIYATGYSGSYFLKQQGKGTAPSDPATFTNCRYGVWTEAMSIDSKYNKVLGPLAETAYHVRYSGGRKVTIAHNDLDVQRTGVDLRFNDGAYALTVNDNHILFGTSSGPANKGAAIYVREQNGNNPDSRIHHNEIAYRPTGTTGIHMVAASGYVVSDNTMAMTGQAGNIHGMNLSGCTELDVSCNAVFGVAGSQANWSLSHPSQAGLRVSMGGTNTFACNQVDRVRQGIIFNGFTSGPTELKGNELYQHDIGLLLTQGAIIGPQVAQGNIWNNQATTIDAEWVGALSAAGNNFFVNILNPLSTPFNYSPPDWFVPTPQTNYECIQQGTSWCDQYQVTGGSERSQELDEAVMLGTIENGIYTLETRLTLAYELYAALLQDPTLYANGPYTADFIALMQGSPAEELYAVEEEKVTLYELPAATLSVVQQNDVDIAVLMDQVAVAYDQLASGGLSPAQVIALEADIAAWEQSMASMTAYNKTAIANADAAREVEAQLLESDNAAISSTELIEQNAKAVHEIYLKTIAKTGKDVAFDAVQAATLFAIADQCPLLGGNAVFQARSLYALVDQEIEFSDEQLCLVDGYVVKSVHEPNISVLLYPNPNRDGRIFYEFYGYDEKACEATIELYDLRGKRITQRQTSGCKGMINVSDLAQGIYHWFFKQNGSRVAEGKITVL